MFQGGNEGMSMIPGFNQIQFEGFCRFINQGLTKELCLYFYGSNKALDVLESISNFFLS